jgi:cytoskeletal protein RodZ
MSNGLKKKEEEDAGRRELVEVLIVFVFVFVFPKMKLWEGAMFRLRKW